jgi:hypothetical protein
MDRLRFWSVTRCDISVELEFIASHFSRFIRRSDAMNAVPFSLLYEILGQTPQRFHDNKSLHRVSKTTILSMTSSHCHVTLNKFGVDISCSASGRLAPAFLTALSGAAMTVVRSESFADTRSAQLLRRR